MSRTIYGSQMDADLQKFLFFLLSAVSGEPRAEFGHRENNKSYLFSLPQPKNNEKQQITRITQIKLQCHNVKHRPHI
jgi:hypothetical protein